MIPGLRRGASAPERGNETRLRLGLERVENLPTLPEVITQIVALVEDPSVSVQQVAEVVGRDQAMVASILRLVNSPFYGLRGRITSIHHSVVLLGLRTVRNMALSSVLVKSFSDVSRDRRFDRKQLWRHTVACAVGARCLSAHRQAVDPEEAFLAGLLHDIGLVILDQYFHEEFCRVLDTLEDPAKGLLEAEREVLGMTHAGVGGLLARRWNFPAEVVECISCHHEPGRAGRAAELTALVHLAHALKDTASDGTALQAWERTPVEAGAYTIARISKDEFTGLRGSFEEEWANAQAFLQLLP